MSELLAYDSKGKVVATLGHVVARNEGGEVIGLVDFEAHEIAGGKLRDIWDVASAIGSETWPEWLGAGAHAFTVELDKDKRITTLAQKEGGHRGEGATVLAAIATTPVVQ